MNREILKVKFQYPIYPSLTLPYGFLPKDKAAQACWYYYTLAQKQYENVGKSTEDQFALDSEALWMDKHYGQLARSIAKLYSLESPSEFMKYWMPVSQMAAALNLPEPKQEYKNPKDTH